VVQEDAHFSIVAALVTEGVLDSRHVPSGGTGEVVGTHCNANATLEFDLVVLVHTI